MTRSGFGNAPSATRTGRRRVAAVAACLVVGVSGALAGAGVANAGPITKTLTYSCEFPLVGFSNLVITGQATLPDSGVVGQQANIADGRMTVAVNEELVAALGLFEAATLEGTAIASGEVTQPNATTTVVPFTLDVPLTHVPTSGTLQVPAIVNNNPSFTPAVPGPHTISIGATFQASLTAKKADGSPTDLGTFPLSCSANPATQDRTLATITAS